MNSLQSEDFQNLSKDELIVELKNSRSETFKYVNKFLELEEKWTFINLFLKELNSIRQKTQLCQKLCDGFLKLTNSNFCFCCLFNLDSYSIEIEKSAATKNSNTKKMNALIEKINIDCNSFLNTRLNIEDIGKYFNSVSGKNIITVPIIYSKAFLGYLVLMKEDSNFYNENINFINIFPEHIALILENISLYQESEKQNKRKVEFLAGISHEFKTPLNSIIGFTEILKSKIEKSNAYSFKKDSVQASGHQEYSKYINNILQSSKHLLSLIEDVIDVSKSQYKMLELNYSKFKPKEQILQITMALEEMAKEKNIQLNYTMLDMEISADVKRFRQLIYNLVSNAIKFNKKHGEITILTYIEDNNFYFEISDTGDGISKRNYDKIFDFFSQVNRSQLKRQLGSGVGLALCKKIIDAHGGEISFESKLKKGSRFWFSLPLVND